MKVICNRGALLDGILVAGTVVSSRQAKLALQCLKLTAKDGLLTISASDTEITVRYSDAQVQIEQEGEALLPADKLRDIVRESVDDALSIDTSGESAVIKGGDSRFRIFTQNPADFVDMPDVGGECDFRLAGGQLKQLINQTLFAASKEATRYAFNGVLVVAKEKKVQFVATDGRRLALARGDLAEGVSSGAKAKFEAIIPTKTLVLLDKLLTDPDEQVEFQKAGEEKVIIRTPRSTLTSSVVQGTFPPYEDVIPKETDKRMTAATAEFLSAIKRSALLTTEESKGIRMSFSRKGVTLSSRNPEAGEAEVNFACKYDGADVEIGFNPAFLVEALRVVDTDEVLFELIAPNRPGLLKAGGSFEYVIMPVSLT
jgi:DNA polymerase-3 subunit beta